MSSTTGVEDTPIETKYRVEEFLTRESELVDQRRFDEWLDLLAEDVVYQVPARQTKERNSGDEFDSIHHINDNRYRIERRIDRLNLEYAWSENPATRTRHYVSNVRVASDDGEEVSVHSNVLFAHTRRDEPADFVTARREDVLRRVDDGFELAERVIYMDQTVLPIPKLSIFI